MTANQKEFMYSVDLQIAGERYISSSWYGGNTPEEAAEAAVRGAIDHKNRYERKDNPISEKDVTVVSVRLSGNYADVMRNLMNDNS